MRAATAAAVRLVVLAIFGVALCVIDIFLLTLLMAALLMDMGIDELDVSDVLLLSAVDDNVAPACRADGAPEFEDAADTDAATAADMVMLLGLVARIVAPLEPETDDNGPPACCCSKCICCCCCSWDD